MDNESLPLRFKEFVEDSRSAKQNLVSAYLEVLKAESKKNSNCRLQDLNKVVFELVSDLAISDLSEAGELLHNAESFEIFSDWNYFKGGSHRGNTDDVVDPWDLYKEGRNLAEIGKFKEAISKLKESIYLKPDLAYAYFEMGKIYNGMGLFQKAVNLFDFCNRVDPNFPWAYWKKGNALLRLGKADCAIASFQKAIELDDYIEYFHLSLAEASTQLEKNKKL